MAVRYIDQVRYRDEKEMQLMVGYSQVEHLHGWVIWRWSDATVAIPSDRIADIVTSEE